MDNLFKEFDFNASGDVDDDDVRYLMYSSHTDPKASKKAYKRVRDLPGMQKTMVQYLADYNQISSKPMKLVLFLFAVEHILRIARVLQMPRGNALLAGVGGLGSPVGHTPRRAHLRDGRVQHRGVQVVLDGGLARRPQDRPFAWPAHRASRPSSSLPIRRSSRSLIPE